MGITSLGIINSFNKENIIEFLNFKICGIFNDRKTRIPKENSEWSW